MQRDYPVSPTNPGLRRFRGLVCWATFRACRDVAGRLQMWKGKVAMQHGLSCLFLQEDMKKRLEL